MKLINSEYDPATGITEEFYYSDADGKVHVKRWQDVEDQLDDNRMRFNLESKGYANSKGGAHKVATIPFSLIEKWRAEEGFDWFNSTDKERRARLNDPHNRYLLVRPGRL